MKPRRRPVKSEAIRRWSGKTEIGAGRFIGWLDITASKFYDWRERYGKVNEHNCWVPRHFWLEDWEKQAIIGSTPHSAERAGGQPRSVKAESRTALELPMGTIPAAGKTMNAPRCDVFRLTNGKIQSFNWERVPRRRYSGAGLRRT